MKNKIVIILLTLLLIAAIALFGFVYFNNKSDKSVSFVVNKNSNEGVKILVEGEPVEIRDNVITPITLTTVRPDTITIDDVTKEVKIKKLSKRNFVKVDISYKDRTVNYLLKTLPDDFPEMNIENKARKKGYVITSFISKFELHMKHPEYCAVVDMDGDTVYYRRNQEKIFNIYNMQKVILPNKKVRYLLHVEIPNDQSGVEVGILGYQLVMDEKFRPIDKVTLLATAKHGPLLAEEHDMLMLDDNHYIVLGKYAKDFTLANSKKTKIIHNAIQEIKDGKVLFDWTSEDYPELEKICYERSPELPIKDPDYMHINSLAIDPKDNNLVVSSASGYYVAKIDRKTGEIIWILGGMQDQFNIPHSMIFVRQHHAHYLSNGKLALFDNHRQFLSKIYKIAAVETGPSRILIFDLDEKNKKINSVKSIPLGTRIAVMGSIQELDDGGWFIGYGDSPRYSIKLIDKNWKTQWIMKVQKPYVTYRAYYYKSLK